MLRKSLVGSLFCIAMAVPLVLRAADDKAADAKQSKNAAADSAKAEDAKAKGRLPNNWGKLGLTATQKEKVYTIETNYAAKIEELRKMIADLESKSQCRNAQCAHGRSAKAARYGLGRLDQSESRQEGVGRRRQIQQTVGQQRGFK